MAYLFCARIDRHICFNRDYISNCTIGNNTKGQMIPILYHNYDGTEIDWENFFKEREEIKRQKRIDSNLNNIREHINSSFLEGILDEKSPVLSKKKTPTSNKKN